MDNKLCIMCKLSLPVSEFHVNAASPDGRHCYCKNCRKAYSINRPIEARDRDSSSHQIRMKNIDYFLMYRARHKIYSKNYRDKIRTRLIAIKCVESAVQSGSIQVPIQCEVCHGRGPLRSYHWHGYHKTFDVIWLCPQCYPD